MDPGSSGSFGITRVEAGGVALLGACVFFCFFFAVFRIAFLFGEREGQKFIFIFVMSPFCLQPSAAAIFLAGFIELLLFALYPS